MPASMFCDLEQNGFEDQRALQLAFELSMLGLSDNSLTTAAAAGPGTAAPEPETPAIGSLPSAFIVPDEARGKKSQNMTECVPVPSSEHVAEIVGRQGFWRDKSGCRRQLAGRGLGGKNARPDVMCFQHMASSHRVPFHPPFLIDASKTDVVAVRERFPTPWDDDNQEKSYFQG